MMALVGVIWTRMLERWGIWSNIYDKKVNFQCSSFQFLLPSETYFLDTTCPPAFHAKDFIHVPTHLTGIAKHNIAKTNQASKK